MSAGATKNLISCASPGMNDPILHLMGITPESPTLEAAFKCRMPKNPEKFVVKMDDIIEMYRYLNNLAPAPGPEGAKPVDIVIVGWALGTRPDLRNNMKPSPKSITSALRELGAEFGSEAGFGGKMKIEGKAMKAQTAVPFVDTNIIPDRNAGIGSLLWDLQHPQDPDREGPPLLDREFAFIDVGVSRAKVATALKTILAGDLKMDVDYVATELLEAVPYANVTLLGGRAEKIRGYLSGMISSKETPREVTDWHYVVDREGKVSSIAYSYRHYGNEVWEPYFMGRTFLYSGERVAFCDPELNEMLAPDVAKIAARIDLERKRDSDPGQPGPSWGGYGIERNPLGAGLAESGIALQKTDVPQRIKDRQNVLFLGNVLNQYPQDERARQFDRIAANMEEGDIVIVQVDEVEASSIEVLHLKGQGARKTRERVRWINTKTLEIQNHVRGPGSWRQIRVKPVLEPIVSRLMDCLGRKVSSPEWRQKHHRVLVHHYVSHVFGTFFRALPVEETLRVAIREVLRRLPSEGCPKGTPVFMDDAKDAWGGALGLDPNPIVSEADFIHLGLTDPRRGGDKRLGSQRREVEPTAAVRGQQDRAEGT